MSLYDYSYDYSFNPKDTEFTTYLANYYDLPRDEKGFLLWNKKYGEIPQNLGDYITYIFSKPCNLSKKKAIDLVTVIQLRHMAAWSSYKNLLKQDMKNKNSIQTQLENIMEQCITTLQSCKERFGQKVFDNIYSRRKDLLNKTEKSGLYEFFV